MKRFNYYRKARPEKTYPAEYEVVDEFRSTSSKVIAVTYGINDAITVTDALNEMERVRCAQEQK